MNDGQKRAEALRALLRNATAGPWRLDDETDDFEISVVGRPGWPATCYGIKGEWDVCKVEPDTKDTKANAALIVAAVNALPDLLDQLDALTAERDRLIVERDAAYRDGHRAGAQRDADLRRIYDALPRGPRCRDCADEDGRCPTLDRPCDPADWVIEIIRAAAIGAGDYPAATDPEGE